MTKVMGFDISLAQATTFYKAWRLLGECDPDTDEDRRAFDRMLALAKEAVDFKNLLEYPERFSFLEKVDLFRKGLTAASSHEQVEALRYEMEQACTGKEYARIYMLGFKKSRSLATLEEALHRWRWSRSDSPEERRWFSRVLELAKNEGDFELIGEYFDELNPFTFRKWLIQLFSRASELGIS